MYREFTALSHWSSKTHLSYSYDKLVIAVGSVSSTHGVPGLENCFQLKSVADALKIRRRIVGERSVHPLSLSNR